MDKDFFENGSEDKIGSIAIGRIKVEKDDVNMTPVVFISHRTVDAAVADMLRDYLVCAGIPNEYIFCSSLPGNDVHEKISVEVKEKIKESKVNIAIVSKDYYDSAYCLNEAGIIWYQDNIPAVIIALPEIVPSNMQGFIGNDYKLRRLDDSGDVAYIYDVVRSSLNTRQESVGVVTAASQKLVEKYSAFLQKRGNRFVEGNSSCFVMSTNDITTDDEKVVLYYIISKKVRRVSRKDIVRWLIENEIYDVNIDNAFDLLGSIGSGICNGDMLEVDLNLFRGYTANSVAFLDEFRSVICEHQKFSRDRFIEMWQSGLFTDTDKLFVAYIVKNRVSTFGTRWMEEVQVKDILQWELNNIIDGSLSSTYTACLNNFVTNDLVYASGWTSYGNVREYTLCNSLKKLLLEEKYISDKELNEIMNAFVEKLPFN